MYVNPPPCRVFCQVYVNLRSPHRRPSLLKVSARSGRPFASTSLLKFDAG